ncbi:MAG: hypothetical protein V1792_28695 [Pseudomonadota bacterium]
MSNTNNRAVVLRADGPSFFELSASEWVFRLFVEQGGADLPINFHMAPYTPREMKAVLQASGRAMKKAEGPNIRMTSGRQEACIPVFDRCFIKLSNVQLPDGSEPSVESQKAFLDANPHLKVDAVLRGYGGFETVAEEEKGEPTGIFILGDRPPDVRVKLLLKLWSDERKTIETVPLCHVVIPPSATDRFKYDRATGEGEMNTRHWEYRTIEDYDVIESLYDKLACSVEGAVVNGVECVPDKKETWVRLVPYWHKYIVVQEMFRRGRAKNV